MEVEAEVTSIEETQEGISLVIQCSEESEIRPIMREYLTNAEKLCALFDDLSAAIDSAETQISGETKVALAYRMIAENHLQQAWRSIDVAGWVFKGELDPRETRFSDLLSTEDE